ncbi:hypothetical protein PTKIN_Ptkin05aG0175400 [Pterospermum kingtungense]
MVSDCGQLKNVCVIGAGPSGLVAARELRKESHTTVVLEQNHEIGGQWLYEPNVVKSKEKNTEKVMEKVFDAVVVANGHYSHPGLPSIKGMDTWKRKQIHSHVYRAPEPVRNEVVVVVGSSLSGKDISMELVEVAKEVYLSARSEGFSKVISKHHKLHLQPQIESLHEDGRVQFEDGLSVIADTIVYCTGYSYSFPFLDTKGIVEVDDNRVGPLFEHTFPPSLAPSLSFIGIPRKVMGFSFLELQARWIAQVLSGKRKLPSCDDMMQSIKEFYHSKEVAGIPKWYTHDIGDFEYCNKYADYSESPHMEEWRKQLCLLTIKNYLANLETYKDSWSDEEEQLLQQVLLNPHFTRLSIPPQHP